MGRPPCCDKVGIKKGPWTPEEDIILASYIAEHGPGNWRSVPTNTGLLRCSKSCRLRWTNYLRPGIKRGNFTDHEERIIVQLQGVLGNKWAAIASYLPQRTDNDIKNYWNTHLKKKMKKQFQSFLHPQMSSLDSTTFQLFKKSYSAGKRRSFLTDMTHHQISTISKLNLPTSSTTTSSTTTSTSTYASSTENISRLLEGWMKSSPKLTSTAATTTLKKSQVDNKVKVLNQTAANINPKVEEEKCDELLSHEEFESLLSFDENISNLAWENKSSSTADSTIQDGQTNENTHDEDEKLDSMSLEGDHQEGLMDEEQPPFSLLEKWLLDESTGQVLEEMELSSIF